MVYKVTEPGQVRVRATFQELLAQQSVAELKVLGWFAPHPCCGANQGPYGHHYDGVDLKVTLV